MALQTKSISANGSKGHHKFTLTVTENSTSTNNTSSISWAFKLSPISSGYNWVYENSVPVSYTVTINGTKYTGNIMSYDGSSTVTVKSGNNTITHNDNGEKSISFSFSVTSLNVSYLPGSASASGTMALTTITRKATLLTAPNFSDEDNPTITYSNPAGNAVSGLRACISVDGNVDTVAYRDISKTGTSYTFNLTDAERNALRNATTGSNSRTVMFFLRTIIDGEMQHHSVSRTFSIVNGNPKVSGTVIDTNQSTVALTDNPNKLIKYFSNAQATLTVTPQKGASINEDSCVIKNGIYSKYGYTYTFNTVESNEFIFSAEDNRGNVGSITVKPKMVDYVKLTCHILDDRPDGEGKMTVSCGGNYFNGSFGKVSNTLKVQYRYKVSGGSYEEDWSDMTVTITDNSYFASADLEGLDYRETYTFETRATDKLMDVTSELPSVRSVPLFHWGENDFVFEVPVYFNSGIIDTTAAILDDAEETNGTWTPSLSSSAISSYTTRYGWYMKNKQVVTVGFFVKATCRSGYESTNVTISGLPFTPKFSAAGGGMCSGVYVGAGFNFQCFVAETSGSVTTRVQACNNTAQANLSTSAAGCNYRSGGGEITLSGTISFLTT